MTQNNEAIEKWFGETYKDLQFNKAGMTAAWQAATLAERERYEEFSTQMEHNGRISKLYRLRGE